MKYCLATITSPSFMPGTTVMLHSFLKYNPWFNGDIQVYGYDLTDSDFALLAQFPNIHFPQPEKELIQKIDEVIHSCPGLSHKKMVFYSLNIFNKRGYDKYMYIDSDAFFCDSVENLIRSDFDILFSPDGATLAGKAKDSFTYKTIEDPLKSEEPWFNTFNAGIFFFDKKLISNNVYTDLLQLMDSGLYKNLSRPTTDQYILNKYFRNNYQPLPAAYNYRLNLTKIIREKEGTTIGEARIIHFNGKKNPWLFPQATESIKRYHTYRYAFLKWHMEYLDYMQNLHLQSFLKSQKLSIHFHKPITQMERLLSFIKNIT